MKNPKMRFSDRADNYAKYRPGYPGKILEFLADNCALAKDSVVADVGSGTGIVSKLFLENGNRVLAVEPNEEMRRAAEGMLGVYRRFDSVAGAAEDTTLADDSVDLIVVANSLHWADEAAAKVEFLRILRPGGRVAILWNTPRRSGTLFLEALGRLFFNYRTDGGAGGDAEDVYDMTDRFFECGFGERRGYKYGSFPGTQTLDLEGLRGLILSSSSMPAAEEPGAAEMLHDLEEIFHAHESDGEVVVEYKVSVYCGPLS